MSDSSEHVPQTVWSAVDMAKRRIPVKGVIVEILPQTRQSAVHALNDFHGLGASS
jgi:hypothetical protein